MSFVEALTPAITGSAAGLQGIGDAVVAGNAAAAFPTVGVLPPALDPTAQITAAFFGAHAVMYQSMGAEAAVLHQLFVTTMGASAGSYAATEALNAIAVG
jgi:PE family